MSTVEYALDNGGLFVLRMRAMSVIVSAARSLVKRHGGLRAAARATGIDAAYLCRLRAGLKLNPGPTVLLKLGLERTYRKRAGASV